MGSEMCIRDRRNKKLSVTKHGRVTTRWKHGSMPITDDPKSIMGALESMNGYMLCDLPLTFIRTVFAQTECMKVIHMFAKLHSARFSMTRLKSSKVRTMNSVHIVSPHVQRLILFTHLVDTCPSLGRRTGNPDLHKYQDMRRRTLEYIRSQTALREKVLEAGSSEKGIDIGIVKKYVLAGLLDFSTDTDMDTGLESVGYWSQRRLSLIHI